MKPRKPWVAFLLTQLCPGLGQLYNGDLLWTAISFGLSLMLALVSMIFLFDSLQKLLWALFVGLFLDLLLSIQAFRKAKKIKETARQPYQRWWVYLLFVIVIYGMPDGYGLFMPSRIRSFQIPSESMVPNLLVGDRLVADGWAYWGKEPRRGDIVVFDYPREPSTKFVKRLIGLPGDKVELKKGELYLNDQLVPQQRTQQSILTREEWSVTEYLEKLDGFEHTLYRSQPENNEDYGPMNVPEGQYFMMGDNRDRSSDSRVWGFVKRDQIIGRMVYVYFSWDAKLYQQIRENNPGDLGGAIYAALRWNRMGLQVR